MTARPGGPVVLLDVDVLIALAWPNHVAHAAARTFFDAQRERGWATTPFTESGFVRISSNRRAVPTATSPGLALTMLRRLVSLGRHTFWTDDVALVVGDQHDLSGVIGHAQVTDAHLVALAAAHHGRLATFDRGASEIPGASGVVEVLPPG